MTSPARVRAAGILAGLAGLVLTSWSAVPLGAAAAPDGGVPVEAGIVVKKVENLPADFIGGVDVSSVLSLEESGVIFRDEAGVAVDPFEALAEAGVNSVRVRVWNNPFDAQGRGYGAGNVDTERGVEIGRRATAAGMSVLVDFHYSDFWADPARQTVPKAWATMSAAQRATAAGSFTEQSLSRFKAEGVDVTMVQVGNETNNAVAGLTSWPERAALFSAGSRAVRTVLPEAQVVVHYTNPERAGFYADVAAKLAQYGVDYDVFASSYYPFWHGSLANLTTVLTHVAQTYDKQVMVAETSWVRTLEEGDGQPNVIRTDPGIYPVSVQGQATAVRDVVQAVADVPGGAGIGVFYWEPAWLPVGPPDQVEANKVLWQRDGSGWATSYAADYDPSGDVAANWGGSGWENQALFDYQGKSLESINVFSYARTGATAPREVADIEHPTVSVADGDTVSLPASVDVTYNTGEVEDAAVTWSGAEDWISGPGTYEISGTTAQGPTTASVTVTARNFVANPGFESGAASWTVTGTGAAVTWDDPYAGVRSLHFWNANAYSFTAAQSVSGVPAGDYQLSAQGQGDAMGGSLTLHATTSQASSAPFELTGWRAWSTPVVPVTVGADGNVAIRISAALPAGAWGTVDEVSLTRVTQSNTDDTALSAALDDANQIDRSRYTAAALEDVDHAVEIGNVVLAGSTASQDDVDDATALIRSALDALEGRAATEVQAAIATALADLDTLQAPVVGDLRLPRSGSDLAGVADLHLADRSAITWTSSRPGSITDRDRGKRSHLVEAGHVHRLRKDTPVTLTATITVPGTADRIIEFVLVVKGDRA